MEILNTLSMGFILRVLFMTVAIIALNSSASRIRNHSPGINEYNTSMTYPFPTHWPIKVNTSAAELVKTVVPLLFTAGLIENALVKNTGKSVEVMIDQPRTSDTISGGVLFPNLYVYKSCRFYWTNDLNGRAATTVDNQNQTIEVLLYYINKKYSTIEEARQQPDGMAIFSLPIGLASIPNLLFDLFKPYFKKIVEPRSQTQAILSFTYLWYVVFVTEFYYAYQGSYIDEDSGKEYFCATIILHPKVETPFISYDQFKETFLSLKNASGKQLTNVAPLYSDDGRKLVKAFGVTVGPFVF